MLHVDDDSGFETGIALFLDARGAESLTVVTKATLALPTAPDEPARRVEAQHPVLAADEHYGDPESSSVQYPADLVPKKVGTDVGLVGQAHGPTSQLVHELDVLLRVGSLDKRIHVTGDRTRTAGDVTEPLPFRSMPIVYERAYGGTVETSGAEGKRIMDERNPVGVGFRTSLLAPADERLPNLQDERRARWAPQAKLPVTGLGFRPGWWSGRKEFAGTYDERWLAEQCPLPPFDLDPRFFSAAAEGLSTPGFLRGDEPVALVHLSPRGPVQFRLPALEVEYEVFQRAGRHRVRAELWTVCLEPDDERYYVVWGATIPLGKRPAASRSVTVHVAGEVLPPEPEGAQP